MKKLLLAATCAATLISATVSCNNEISTIGSSLIDDQVEIVIDSAFTITGYSVRSNSVPARTILQLLGSIDAEGYGSFASDVVTQFMPMEQFDTIGMNVDQIDSVKMIMRCPNGAYVGDSLMPMGITVYPLTKQLPMNIQSDFDPTDYYDPKSTPLCSTIYTLTAAGYKDIADQPYRYVTMDIDPEFGRNLYRKYLESPSTFATPQAFAQYFPGVYIKNTFGNGRVMQVDSTVVTLYYRQRLPLEDDEEGDTIVNTSTSYLAVATEILTNNNIDYRVSPLIQEYVDKGVPLLVAPTGYDVDITFPGRELVDAYRSRTNALAVVNTLSVSIPVETVANDYGIAPPTYILMVLKSKKDDFFLRSKLPDDETSFYAKYNTQTGNYEFNDMRAYVLYLLNKKEIKDEDVEFTICPVTIGWQNTVTSTTSYYYSTYDTDNQYTIATVTPYINKPTVAILHIEQAKIKFTYSVQSL